MIQNAFLMRSIDTLIITEDKNAHKQTQVNITAAYREMSMKSRFNHAN